MSAGKPKRTGVLSFHCQGIISFSLLYVPVTGIDIPTRNPIARVRLAFAYKPVSAGLLGARAQWTQSSSRKVLIPAP